MNWQQQELSQNCIFIKDSYTHDVWRLTMKWLWKEWWRINDNLQSEEFFWKFLVFKGNLRETEDGKAFSVL